MHDGKYVLPILTSPKIFFHVPVPVQAWLKNSDRKLYIVPCQSDIATLLNDSQPFSPKKCLILNKLYLLCPSYYTYRTFKYIAATY